MSEKTRQAIEDLEQEVRVLRLQGWSNEHPVIVGLVRLIGELEHRLVARHHREAPEK